MLTDIDPNGPQFRIIFQVNLPAPWDVRRANLRGVARMAARGAQLVLARQHILASNLEAMSSNL